MSGSSVLEGGGCTTSAGLTAGSTRRRAVASDATVALVSPSRSVNAMRSAGTS